MNAVRTVLIILLTWIVCGMCVANEPPENDLEREIAYWSQQFRNPPKDAEFPKWERIEAAIKLDELGAVKVGMARAAVKAILGPPDDGVLSADFWAYETSPVSGFLVEFKDGAVVTAHHAIDSDSPPGEVSPEDRRAEEIAHYCELFRNPPQDAEFPRWERFEAARKLDELGAIAKGMTRSDVLAMLGPPDDGDLSANFWHYETSPVAGFYVEFENDVVLEAGHAVETDGPPD